MLQVGAIVKKYPNVVPQVGSRVNCTLTERKGAINMPLKVALSPHSPLFLKCPSPLIEAEVAIRERVSAKRRRAS